MQYIVCEKINGDLKPVGVATTEDKIKSALTTGNYIIIPFQSDVYYGPDWISESAPGAISYTPSTATLQQMIEDLSGAVENLHASFELFRDNATADFSDLSNKVSDLRSDATAAIQNLITRVTSLENA
jgi:hypothetical protein